jgi:hypothetical protein
MLKSPAAPETVAREAQELVGLSCVFRLFG